MSKLPKISGNGKEAVLLVDGKPFTMRAGEIHNSSASDLGYMEEYVWPALQGRHMNAVLAPVYWECIEPEEGVFDFTLVDGLLAQARREGMRLELLWFGLWKNGASTYVPAWVKEDRERFWYVRAQDGDLPTYFGGPVFTISPLCGAAVEADRRAFSALMAHLRKADLEHTVILIQVENEMGVLGAPRDFSPAAEEAFRAPVPAALARQAGASGTWSEVYGDYAGEAFMAWHYAQAVERIASAGKAELPLPMGVNAWLEQEPWTPGTAYPSGGPQAKNSSIWRLAAPSIRFYSPDIYVPGFAGVLREYAAGDNPILIPETRAEAAFYLYALGEHHALCFSPFGIEDISAGGEETDARTLALLRIEPEALAAVRRNGEQLFAAYALTESMEELLTEARAKGGVRGFLCGDPDAQTVELGNLVVDVRCDHSGPADPAGGGLLAALGDYEFLAVGINCALTFRAADGGLLDILTKEEGVWRDGKWVRGRILNGDERYHHTFGRRVSMLRFKLLPAG